MRLLTSRTAKYAGLGLVGLVSIVAGTAALKASERAPVVQAAAAVRPARVMEIAYKPQAHTLTLAGIVAPRIETTLGFRVAGKVVSRDVDVGAIVQPGQLIARIDPTDYQLAVDNTRAALASADADYLRAKADFDRYERLRGTSAFVPQVLDQRQSTASTALARVDQAKSQLSTAQNNLAYTELRADGPGIVTAVTAEAGQVLSQGQGVAKLARTDELEIAVGVPEHRLKAVRETSDATYELWSDPGHRFTARLRELSPSADTATRTYLARFTVVEKPDFIGLGMTATLTFGRTEDKKLAEVPLSAIFQQGAKPALWVVDRTTGAVSLREVVVARWRDDTALIVSGVNDGDIVATAGVHKLEPGQTVKPVLQAAR